ncbi:probable transcriptional regulatory protein Teth514_1449 [Musca vetustissima]|uniref:probable transcriptional regulatory protein Teth514_1449 n=1 Tax=Musca vetustissima TaxID=27455 RepID=UPI002AB60766|nr:probable transcriptional regulatory protein Teth514_1449 [Musca vetustissima]
MRNILFNVLRNNVFQQTIRKQQPINWTNSPCCTTRDISTHLYPLLAGHSKWANIRHIKAAKDGQKSALFSKIARQIRLAIQDGGSADPNLNTELKSVIEEALRKNMPMATIQNNLKKFTASKSQLKKYRQDVRYKQKVFMVCTIYTDNFAQLKMDMSTILRKGGGVQIDAGHLFEDFGLIQATVDKARMAAGESLEDRATEDAIESGAEDVEIMDNETGAVNFVCKPEGINGVRKALENKGYTVVNTEHIYTPLNTVTLSPEEKADYQKFVDKLKEIQGIEDIYDNIEIDDGDE